MHPTHPVILGVAGGSGSGETTIARGILAAAGRDRLPFLSQYSYTRQRWADVMVPEGGRNRVALGMVTARNEQLRTAVA